MRITYAKLVGYAGFYTGLGKNELEIDFTKCKNHIVVISGANGCGKSTLLNALSILPDSNDCFLPCTTASKQLQVINQDVIYDILITHKLDGKSNPAKAYIKKNGVELNANGNISSYKEIIFNEFNLDNNFISLTHISGDNRGLADKKPSERKKFVANITSSLEVYNDINKKLSKKSNIYRSHINSLSSKIQNIGDETSLRSSLVSLKSRSDRLSQDIDILKQKLVECKTVLTMNDTNGILKQRYDNLIEQVNGLEKNKNQAFSFFRNFKESNFPDFNFESAQDINTEIQNNADLIDKTSEEYFKDKEQLITYNSSIQTINSNIDQITIKINKLQQEINPQLEEKISSIQNEMKSIEELFLKNYNGSIEELSTIDNSNLQQIISCTTEILQSIDVIYESIPHDYLNQFIQLSLQETPISIQITELGDSIAIEKDKLIKLKEQLSIYENDHNLYLELNNRPNNCKIDNCYFLLKYKDIVQKYSDIKMLEKQIDNLNSVIEESENIISKNQETMNLIKDWVRSESILDKVRTISVSNNTLFNKLSVYRRLGDWNFIIDQISNGRSFNDYKVITDSIISISNELIQYKSLKSIYDSLSEERIANQNNVNALNDFNLELNKLNNDLDNTKQLRDVVKKTIDFSTNIINRLQTKESNLKELKVRYENYIDLQSKYDKTNQELDAIKEQFKGSADILQQMVDINNQIITLQNELIPINDQKQIIDNQILLLDSYQKDYADYYSKFNVIDKLKKYSSPTSGGIQTLFMSLYMGQTITTANQLLGMFFQGQYQLMDYVINENEFRMPFASNGFVIDDISNGSTSQICMMGMIINLVLLHQASTVFNIARLDEIDGGLDSANRNLFVDTLQKIIQILGIDQLFIISHSCEAALSNVDLIQLSPVVGYTDTNIGANIIYSWKD